MLSALIIWLASLHGKKKDSIFLFYPEYADVLYNNIAVKAGVLFLLMTVISLKQLPIAFLQS